VNEFYNPSKKPAEDDAFSQTAYDEPIVSDIKMAVDDGGGYCTKCGAALPSGSAFCMNCGARNIAAAQTQSYPQASAQTYTQTPTYTQSPGQMPNQVNTQIGGQAGQAGYTIQNNYTTYNYTNSGNYTSQQTHINQNVYNDTHTAGFGKRGRKDKTVAILLCIFLGYFGIHRLYEGKIASGLLWMFTGGLGGIGWILDLIILALKPRYYNS